MKDLLFDISPEERDGQQKKASKRKKQAVEDVQFLPRVEPEPVYGYMASIEGHYQCDRCGLTILDLLDIVKVDGQRQWRVICGWLCGHSWLVDPIPGLLDELGSENEKQAPFRVISGRFDGMTFDEIEAAGHGWYMVQEVKRGKRKKLVEEAARWLAAKDRKTH